MFTPKMRQTDTIQDLRLGIGWFEALVGLNHSPEHPNRHS